MFRVHYSTQPESLELYFHLQMVFIVVQGANGAAVSSVTEISKVQQKVVKEDGITEVDVSKHRVFLLGENRWEEPSRLGGRDKKAGETKTKASTTKCLTCRGEGRLMCTGT